MLPLGTALVSIVFLNPPLRLASDFIDYPFFANLGLLSAAAACRAGGREVVVLDALAQPDSVLRREPGGTLAMGGALAPLLAPLEKERADAVVVAHGPFVHPRTAGAALLDEVLRAVRARAPGVPLILADCAVGGMHYRDYDPDAMLARTGADALCRYAPDEALPALLTRLHDLPRVVNGAPPSDLDALPPPAFDLIDLDAYDRFLADCFGAGVRAPLFGLRGRALPLLLSRGCPYRCVFCTSNPGRKTDEPKRWDAVTPRRAAVLIRHLARAHGARTIVLLDDVANLDEDRFTTILEEARRARVRLEVPNGLRADRLTRRHLELLRGRTSSVSISAESGSQRVVDEVIGKRLDLAEVRRVAADCRDLDLPLRVHFLMGLPGERRAEMLETLRLAWQLHEDYGAQPAVQFAAPLEGSALERAAGAPGPPEVDVAAEIERRPLITAGAATAAELTTARQVLRARLAAEATAKLVLNLSYRCNNRCVFCAVGDRAAAGGSFEMHRRILAEHAARGVRMLDLDGGEPTLVPHLIRLVGLARRLGYTRIAVTTNGRRLAYADFAERLVPSGLTDLLVSLHGATADVHERLTRAPGSFAQTVAGIENAVRANAGGAVALAVNTTLTRDSFAQLPELARLVRRLGVPTLNVQFVTPFGRASAAIVPDPAAAAGFVRQVIEEHEGALRVQVINLPLCFMPDHAEALLPDLLKHQRNMVFVSAEEVNLLDYLRTGRERREACAECLYSVACEGFYRFADPVPQRRPRLGLVDLILGYRCNSRCAFCAIDEELRPAGFDAAAAAAQIRAAAAQSAAIRFGGGEPTLWPELPDLVALAREVGFREVSVQTNGFLLGRDGLAARLIDAGLTKLNVSLRGATAATHDRLTRSRGSFDDVLRALAAVHARAPGLPVEGDVIITRQTLPELAAVVRRFGPLGVRRFNFWYVAMEGRVRGHERALVPRLAEVAAPLRAALEAADALGLQPAQSFYVPCCLLPGREAQVWHPADESALVVTPQSTFRLEQGEIDVGQRTARCRGCRFEARCVGLRRGYLERFGDSELRPMR
jgi:MoaA/NifB/PqqE/SkfB family radical SAM enzyme